MVRACMVAISILRTSNLAQFLSLKVRFSDLSYSLIISVKHELIVA